MRGKNKHTKNRLKDFLRYRENKMSDKEKNLFERELQKDPFLEEAAEGISTIVPEDTAKDMDHLYKRLKDRTLKTKRMTWYRIAASVAVLMIISSIYIVLDRTTSSKLSEEIAIMDTIQINKKNALRKDETVSSGPVRISQNREKLREKKAESAELSQVKIAPSEQLVAEKEEKAEEYYVAVADKSEDASAEQEQAALASAPEESDSFVTAYDQNISGRRLARSVTVSKASLHAYNNAVPAIGKDSFDIYIEKNVRIPEQHKAGQTAVVKLSFIVSETGTPDDIKIVSSPGIVYSDEAIRLLKEGPLWKPSDENMEITDKQIINIIFRQYP